MRPSRARLSVLAVVCIAALASAAAYVVGARAERDRQTRAAPRVGTTAVARVLAGPRILFRTTNPRTGYGDLAMVALAQPGGPRAITATACDRLYAARRTTVCLATSAGVLTTYSAFLLDEAGRRVRRLPLTGVPSRTRLSADARYVATTSFTAGDSYAATSFSTRTVISTTSGRTVGDLENFTLRQQGHVVHPVDRNYWGVTFARDDRTFFATVAYGGQTWLVRGDLLDRTMITLHQDAECPSLSPDGRHVVFKQRGDLPPGHWRLVAYDVATGLTVPLAETRSVDDQVEWLDPSHVLYGLPRGGSGAARSDVWSVPADGSGHPTLMIRDAWSPAVVRSP